MKKDLDGLKRLIERQAEAGADYLDLNAALMGEAELEWLCRLAEMTVSLSDVGVMLDSPSAAVLKEASKSVTDRPLILNSVTAAERIDELLPVLVSRRMGVVALPMGQRMPKDAQERLEAATGLIERLTAAGVREEDIFIDALVEALSADDQGPAQVLRAIRMIRDKHPKVHVTAGLSNVSFGLPGRAGLNATFLAMAIAAGLDSAILDVNSESITDALIGAEALIGADEYSMEYIRHMRKRAQGE